MKMILRSFCGGKGMVFAMDKQKQEKLEARRRQEDIVFNKMLVWFLGAVVFGMLVLFLKRFYINYDQMSMSGIQFAITLRKVLGVLRFVSPVLFAGGAAWFAAWKKKQKSLVLPGICALAGLALTLVAFLGYHYHEFGVNLLGIVAPAVAVLAVIFFLYQREFFYSAILSGMGIVALWVYRKAFLNHPRMIYAGFALVGIVVVLAVVLAWKLSRSDGKLGKFKVLDADASYLTVYLSAALTALTLAVALALGATVAYYAIFLLVAWVFCMVVYYTVRLM